MTIEAFAVVNENPMPGLAEVCPLLVISEGPQPLIYGDLEDAIRRRDTARETSDNPDITVRRIVAELPVDVPEDIAGGDEEAACDHPDPDWGWGEVTPSDDRVLIRGRCHECGTDVSRRYDYVGTVES